MILEVSSSKMMPSQGLKTGFGSKRDGREIAIGLLPATDIIAVINSIFHKQGRNGKCEIEFHGKGWLNTTSTLEVSPLQLYIYMGCHAY